MATFTVSDDQAYIIGRFTENLSEAAAFTLLDDLLAISTATGLRQTLIDARRITVPLNTTAIYRLGLTLVERLPPPYTLAVVMGHQAGADPIFQTVVASRGLTIRYFTKLDAARGWLLESQRQAPDAQ
jgi:hypothetical protein